MEGNLSSSEVLSYSPTAFRETYRALRRREVEKTTEFVYAANQAVNGSKQSIPKFIATIDIWGGKLENSSGKIAAYQASLMTR